jgi:hypothetical protein
MSAGISGQERHQSSRHGTNFGMYLSFSSTETLSASLLSIKVVHFGSNEDTSDYALSFLHALSAHNVNDKQFLSAEKSICHLYMILHSKSRGISQTIIAYPTNYVISFTLLSLSTHLLIPEAKALIPCSESL